mgnify:FL=1
MQFLNWNAAFYLLIPCACCNCFIMFCILLLSPIIRDLPRLLELRSACSLLRLTHDPYVLCAGYLKIDQFPTKKFQLHLLL